MNEQKKLDVYFRVNLKDENGELHKCIDNKVQNILHSIIMEIEKGNTPYNRFKEDYKIQFLNLDNENMKLEIIKEFKFTELGAKNYGQAKPNNNNN